MASVKLKKGRVDMLHGPLLKKIILFALPLALGGILQSLFSSADVAVIGFFESSESQAAVNSNGALINLIINLFVGLSIGVTVVIANFIGLDKTADVHSVVFTSFVIASVSGVFILIVGVLIAEPVLRLMQTPESVLPLAAQYLKIYFLGMPFLMVYNFGATILRSVGDTARPLYVLLFTGVLNIGLNLLLVAVAGMNVAGVAIATVVSNAVSAAAVAFFIMRDDMLKIRFGKSRITKEYLKKIFVIGLPAGVQGMVFSLSNVIIQTAINGFGDKAMAGSGDSLYFESYVYYFVTAFAQATTTFFGQNYAAGLKDRCRKIFRLNMFAALIVSTVLCLIFTLGGRLFMRIYSSDPDVINFAVLRMWVVLSGEMLACLYEIAGGALRGLGRSVLPAIITIGGSCLLRVIWVYTLFAAFPTFVVLLLVYPASWLVTGIAMLIAYFVITRKSLRAVPAEETASSQDTETTVEAGETATETEPTEEEVSEESEPPAQNPSISTDAE